MRAGSGIFPSKLPCKMACHNRPYAFRPRGLARNDVPRIGISRQNQGASQMSVCTSIAQARKKCASWSCDRSSSSASYPLHITGIIIIIIINTTTIIIATTILMLSSCPILNELRSIVFAMSQCCRIFVLHAWTSHVLYLAAATFKLQA